MTARPRPPRILVVGSGGREHAICRALDSGDDGGAPPALLCAPGNPGTARHADNVRCAADDIPALVALARDRAVDLVLPGPEGPLAAGLADALAAAGIPCCGPVRAAAQLEASKAFARTLAAAAGVPGPGFAIVRTPAELADRIAGWDGVPVLKADGLCAGKGVLLPDEKDDCLTLGKELLDGRLGAAGRVLVLEERLHGVEASLIFACHGEQAVALPSARDYKRLRDGERGPNTGGMGAVSPSPAVSGALQAEVRATIVAPLLHALARRGTPYVGFLYVGLMLTAHGPRLLECNVRLGDPEAQVILPRLRPGEFLRLCRALAAGRLEGLTLTTEPAAACAVVLAAAGYPAQPQPHSAQPLRIDPALHTPDRWLIHAGTRRDEGGALRASGGRIAAVVARGTSIAEARARAYEGVDLVHGEALIHRRDIGLP